MSVSKKQEGFKTRLTKRDITMLLEMYQLQAIRARDLVDVYFNGKRHGFDRLQELCARKYIEREFTVKDSGQQNHSVYNIADDGINVLYRLGELGDKSQPRRARDNKLQTLEMLLRIEASKIAINIAKAGWQVKGGKDGKQQLSLPPNSLTQMVLTSAEGETYQVYVCNKSIQDQTLSKLIAELEETKHKSIILYKADNPMEETPAYKSIVNKITEQDISKHELCLLPMAEWEEDGRIRNLAIECLINSDQSQVEQYLAKHYSRIRYSDNRYHFGEIVVEEEGKDYMVCSYLRRDQTSLRALARHLTRSEYENIGTGAIVLTWRGFADEVQQVIDSYQKRDFIQVRGMTTQEIIESQR